MRTEAPLLAPIFRSDGQARLLSTMLLSDGELSISDLARQAGLAYPSTHREVERLIEAGILESRNFGRTRLISANAGSPLVPPLREILTIATGPVPALRGVLEPIEGIVSAFIYGSFAARLTGVTGPDPQDIDVMVVGEPVAQQVYDACDQVEQLVHRAVNPTILTVQEFRESTGFLETVRTQPAVHILGEELWE